MTDSLDQAWQPPRWTPELFSDEAAHGLYVRLCDINGIYQTDIMRARTGVSLPRTRLGFQLPDLARIAHCSLPALEQHAYRGGSGTQLRFRNQILRGRDDLTASRRLCPECLAEEPYHRFWWDLSFIDTCPAHRRRLVTRCACGGPVSWKSGLLRCCHLCASDKWSSAPMEPDAGILAVDAWLISRFGPVVDDSADPPLKGVGVRHAVDLLERVGAMHLRGRDDRLAGLEDLGLDAAYVRARGYEVIREGRLESVSKSAGIRNLEHWLASICESSNQEIDLRFVEDASDVSVQSKPKHLRKFYNSEDSHSAAQNYFNAGPISPRTRDRAKRTSS